MTLSVAMTAATASLLQDHLAREDGQEDICLATYATSTGATRTTAIIKDIILPRDHEREVHGNATITGAYVLRAATEASTRGEGIVLIHSHPHGIGWQGLSGPDYDTEMAYERVAKAVTGLPLLGMTLGVEGEAWSARRWPSASGPEHAESVRIVGDTLGLTWNDAARPRPAATRFQKRTVSAWGAERQSSIARLKVLVVGVGSVGLDIIPRLAATGVELVGAMDIDKVEDLNLDRMIGATREDARLGRRKTEVAGRLARDAATAANFQFIAHDVNITTPDGLAAALDYDVIFSCVDRPWPRSILNEIAYSDLIPVIDGGISLDTLPTGGMRGATWRMHTLVPGRACMECNGQLDINDLALERNGLLDDPEYIKNAGMAPRLGSPNVAVLAASVSAGQLAQFVSLVAQPGGLGVPAPLRYALAAHHLEHLPMNTRPHCVYENQLSVGDARIPLTRSAPTAATAATASTPPEARSRVFDRLRSLLGGLLRR